MNRRPAVLIGNLRFTLYQPAGRGNIPALERAGCVAAAWPRP
jgi:hypothetical protein